jgi:deoxyribose-phosphate aldolase
VKICTVIGFPNGYSTTATKVFETGDALDNGADEIDMVINLGWVKDCKWDDIEHEIRILKETCGDHVLKVIIETCMLTDEEKIRLCEIVTFAGADYIKTSTGFGGGGATFEDVDLMVKNVGEGVKVKASGGISGLEDAEKYLEIGAKRLGTSKVVKAAKAQE